MQQVRLRFAKHATALGHAKPLPPGPRRPRPLGGASDAAINSRWIVWNETASTDLTIQPWTMYAYNRNAGHTTEVTHAPRLADGSPPLAPPGWTGPKLAGSRVIWAQVGGRKTGPHVDIVGCPLRSCSKPKVLIRGAAYPSVTTQGVYAVRTAKFRGQKAAGDGTAQILFHRFKDGTTKVVRRLRTGGKTGSITGLSAAPGVLAWTRAGARGGPATTTISTRHHTVTVKGLRREDYGYPVATRTFVAWAEDSGNGPAGVGGYLYQLKTDKVYSIGSASGLYAIHAAGSYLSWQRAEDPGAAQPTVTEIIAKVS